MTTPATLGEQALRQLGVAVVPVADRPALTTQVAADTIATDALIALGVIASDETPSATDQALALAKLRAVQASLAAQALVWWPDTAVPQAVAGEYESLTAIHLASSFGKQADPNRIAALEARVKHIALVLSAPDTATAAVLDIHNELAATGRVRWTSEDIPRPAERAYVDLAANQLAPLFGAKADPASEISARRLLAQLIALPSSGERTQAEYF
jgi:hypothetical protein